MSEFDSLKSLTSLLFTALILLISGVDISIFFILNFNFQF